MTRFARAAYFAAAPAICLALFWRVLFSWFLSDDFAWLGKPLEVQSFHDLPAALFRPEAQGTIRVLSERLFFLVFSSIFGLHALPYRLWILATWFADLTLASLIGARLTGSRAAGLVAAILWAASLNITYPLSHVAAYNQILYSLCILSAFYARLRRYESDQKKWKIAEWAAYLAGFGALETVVMYPALAALHALLLAPKRLRSTLPLFIPAAIFGALHLLLIPKTPGGYYDFIVDGRLPRTLLLYMEWSLGPSRLDKWISHAHWPGALVTGLIAIALLLFAIDRFRRRDYAGLFFIGWFLLLIAPVLPLPNHVVDYYLPLPELGLAWLGGWAIVAGWRAGAVFREVSISLAALYLIGSAVEIDGATRFFYENSVRMRTVVLGLRDAVRANPNAVFLLAGVDNDLFRSGFEDNPFRLYGLKEVYLAPGSEKAVEARADLGGMARWSYSPQAALHAIEHGRAHVYQVLRDELKDVTHDYEIALRADPHASRVDFVDAGDASYSSQLGSTWYSSEGGLRWMPKMATIRMSGPPTASEKLYVTGYVPPPIVAAGPVTLRFSAGGGEIGTGKIEKEGPFSFQFALPAALAGQQEMEIAIEASRVLRPANDPRDFGAVFGTFAVR